ncbi:DUF262 domain-containing protein [Campylobacter sp. MIT 12-5580]|uniref:DUF262 domain-containing protein n=1 Tax=Campylobacter sp. MIT 12-5580 TaxID=2040651 RepID=UPI0010F7AD18|nr:DUF262 domain-containing protein [Campylobacter sp. MIT 12-5580]TKX29626.1 DUF262 domain-containing protein [Campylobacter sp. MIT 12-5580]
MDVSKESIKKFFSAEKEFFIPVYQRAYSWEQSQWQAFLEDLKEAQKGENSYFFGNVLLEELDSDFRYDIIDGQQRLSTIAIFIRACIEVLAQMNIPDSDISKDEFLHRIQEDYLIYRDKAKLQAVEYDRDYFDDFIIKGVTNKHEPQTPSQERIKKAKDFFVKELKKLTVEDMLKIFEVMQSAEILSIPFSNKKDSVLMFELQNNRGKDLTNMEKLKSYLAYQIYTYSNDPEAKLKEISKIFEEIYRLIKDIKKGEDSILSWFNISRTDFSYRENDNSLNYKKELKQIDEADQKIKWINGYMCELKNAFVDFKSFENSSSIYKEYLEWLDVSEVYPFVIKAYRLFRTDATKLEQVFKSLEIIAFRDKFVGTKANLASRLSKVLKEFHSPENLVESLKAVCSEKEKYWSDEALDDLSRATRYWVDSKVLQYLFMRYENYLRQKDTTKKAYRFSLNDIEKPEIEHIAPQKEDKEKLASGYCKYDEEFIDSYLHSIGNLVLISKSHNASIGNKPFVDKLQSFKNNSLIQQAQIETFIITKNIWDKKAIDKRCEALEKFVLETWSFK